MQGEHSAFFCKKTRQKENPENLDGFGGFVIFEIIALGAVIISLRICRGVKKTLRGSVFSCDRKSYALRTRSGIKEKTPPQIPAEE